MIFQGTAQDTVAYMAKGIADSFKAALIIELEKQARSIIEATAERLACGIVARMEQIQDPTDFMRTKVVLNIDGVERLFDEKHEVLELIKEDGTKQFVVGVRKG